MQGSSSLLRTVGLNSDYRLYVAVCENTGRVSLLHFLKNLEVPEL